MTGPYFCPPCRDSGRVLVRRHAPEHPDAARSGFVLEWRPCPARPCRAPKDEAASVPPAAWEAKVPEAPVVYRGARLESGTIDVATGKAVVVIQTSPHPSGELFP